MTDNFLVATYWFHTDVIRLDDVRYLSKNRVEERSGRELYRLTLSEPETDLFYEIDFREEELYGAILYYQQRERRFGKTSEQLIL